MRLFLYLTAFVIGAAFWTQGMLDPDLGWHLVGGDWILASWSFPNSDFISAFNEEWRDYHWLFEVGVSYIYGAFGLGGIQLVFGALSGLLIIILLGLIRLEEHEDSVPLALLFLLLGVIAYLPGAALRPQLVSLIMLGASLKLLRGAESRHELLILYGLTAFLANIHVFWIFNPIFYFIFRVLPSVRKDSESLKTAAIGTAALLAAGVVSPYGWKNISIVIEYAGMPGVFRREIPELKSIFAVYSHALWAYVFGCGAAFLGLKDRASDNRPEKLAAILGMALPALSIKFLGIYMLTTVPYGFKAVRSLVRETAPTVLNDRALSYGAITIIFAGFLWRAASTLSSEAHLDPLSALNSFYPISACEAVGSALRGNTPPQIVAVSFDDGGWCAWAARRAGAQSIRVTGDGRTQDVDAEHFLLNQKLFRAEDGWAGTLKAWSPQAVVLRKEDPLLARLKTVPEWRIRFEDQVFAVFTRPASI